MTRTRRNWFAPPTLMILLLFCGRAIGMDAPTLNGGGGGQAEPDVAFLDPGNVHTTDGNDRGSVPGDTDLGQGGGADALGRGLSPRNGGNAASGQQETGRRGGMAAGRACQAMAARVLANVWWMRR